jgi:hypothetical protein
MTFLLRSLCHLTESFLQKFNEHVNLSADTYYSCYAGDIASLLNDVDCNFRETMLNEKSPPGAYKGLNYPWNVTYPLLLDTEGPNDGLVSVRSAHGLALPPEKKFVYPLLHPNFARDWFLPLHRHPLNEKPVEDPDHVLMLLDDLCEDLCQQGL